MNFSDLDERTKDRLRDKVRYMFVDHGEWWDAVYEDFKRVCSIIGIDIAYDHRSKRDRIYFTGFYSQGDCALYEGEYSYTEGALDGIVAYAPEDKELHRIVGNITEAQVACKLHCSTTICTRIDSDMRMDSSLTNDEYGSWYEPLEKQIESALDDLARWLFSQLESEHDYLTSDEVLDEWLSEPDNLTSIYDESEALA